MSNYVELNLKSDFVTLDVMSKILSKWTLKVLS